MIHDVVLSEQVKKILRKRKIPAHVARKLGEWIDAVKENGLENVRMIPGYHDEALCGDREGQRSIRLSIAYRAFYVICSNGAIEFVSVEEVNKHDY
jgi:toxin HigB-1